jgi:hypothetical protein
MFSGYKDPIRLLEWLEASGRIVLSPKYPYDLDPRTPGIDELEFNSEMAAVTVNFMGPRPGPMQEPCVYINSNQFVAKDIPVNPEFGLYTLSPADARAIIIIHELGHAAGCFQPDWLDSTGEKSVQNTDCVRKNCVPCKVFEFCGDALQQPADQPRQRKKE